MCVCAGGATSPRSSGGWTEAWTQENLGDGQQMVNKPQVESQENTSEIKHERNPSEQLEGNGPHRCRCCAAACFWPEPPSHPGSSTAPSGFGCAAGSEALSADRPPTQVHCGYQRNSNVQRNSSQEASVRLAFITCGLPRASSCSSRLDLAKVTSAPNRSYSLHERSNSWKEKQPAPRSGDWERFPHSFLLVFLLNSKLRMDQLSSAS